MRCCNKIFASILVSAIFIATPVQSALAGDSAQLLANFIYNISDHIVWGKKEKVTICTLGYDQVGREIKKIEKRVNAGSLRLYNIDKIKFRNFVDIEEVASCDVLYISETEERYVHSIFDKISSQEIVTISTLENFSAKGGMFELRLARRKVKLKISKDAMQRAGVELSPVVLISMNPEINEATQSASK